jgi:hypothetical protein
MPSIRIYLDEATSQALNRVVEKGQRGAFIRGAIFRAIAEVEEARMRRAYEEQPDSESKADDWSNAEPWDSSAPVVSSKVGQNPHKSR